ncbi:hypothetical protein [Cryobacterium sp. CG_9.6]|uniref:hypothetical protein n=1 Tax=Cryobacterium sp. CG_9.6 TaxID=2760710 RepID=UPI0024730240|nr:hypothetical protein [Cryobacterium sp. CG_9.6]MDH6235876.1 hypothetical protein [Cryobacterium sp. CG_9.6]
MFILGIIMIVASAVCSVAAVRLTSRANPGVFIPLLSNPPARSRAGTALMLSTVGLMIWGGNLVTADLGGFVFLILIVVVLGPYLAVRFVHNRAVARLEVPAAH